MTDQTMRERKKEATKAGILNAAIELINTNGFTATTMQHIAGKADVALRTLYNYFPSKESIVATYLHIVVEDQARKRWDQIISLDSTYNRLLAMCRISAQWMTENATLIEVYALDPRHYFYGVETDEIPRSGYEDFVEQVVTLGQNQGDISPMFSAAVITQHYMGVYYSNILTWLGNPEQDLLEIFKEGLDVFYQGIKAESVDAGVVLAGMFF
ncbi:TetR/AcrR family transcriptional regulator [Phosphitispora fastidiosa]|uniref:TetR/AcrR family transcriptional regulator n=1 Tax=Phosphitispora fastidiosa TaxID=2837202 RepID=UPI001E4B4870|nr:TetR/AcrR family transcriptional regulator [Phosphitispora fastidiosa]MBU7008401.1 AcrR family transcriptional regulator [Phosphitispora fastidiosa]